MGRGVKYAILFLIALILFLFFLIYFIPTAETGYFNMTDGFSVSSASSGAIPRGITTNFSSGTPTDFWVATGVSGITSSFVYHFNRTGGNMTGGFSTFEAGLNLTTGITTNGSDFWITDWYDAFVYHFNRTGGNMTGGFSTSEAGSSSTRGITTNGSDFWVVDSVDAFVYHFNRTGGNMTSAGPISSINAIGQPGFHPPTNSPDGITTNGSDFWITASSDPTIYHFNRTGGSMTGFSYFFGSQNPHGIAQNTNASDFWIVDSTDKFVYHFYNDITNPQINITFPLSNNTITSNVNYNINYTRSDENVLSGCKYSNDTYSVNTTLANCGNITAVTWSEGKHNVTIYVNDSGRNLNSSTISFTIDSVAPDLNITQPLMNNTNTTDTNQDINFTFSDSGVGFDSCWYSNDTYTINLSLGSGGTCANITNITWGEGLHNVTIYTNDTLGNLNYTTRSFTIDFTNPTATITCSSLKVQTGDIFPCSCSGSDSGIGINSTATTEETTSPDGVLSSSTTGTFTYTCAVRDLVGNSATSTTDYIIEQRGSGDVSGGATVSVDVTSEQTYIVSLINPENPAVITNVDSVKTLIKEIQIDVKEQTQNVRISVVAYNKKPTEISKEKSGTIYKYLKINVENLDSKLEKAKITIQLNKTTIENKEDISLFRFNNISRNWDELQTNYTSEDEKYYYYETSLSSFSYFVIGEKAKVLPEIIAEEISETYDKTSQTRLGLIVWWLVFAILIVLIIIIILLLAVFINKNREYEGNITQRKTI
ncbi:MAG TPA: PGF-pre-PGF domain-containing protein [Candidatus Nanoarchaeia archaeon]|nr:PGF-pre-PGF domain-containing protein [Candidatus Nanoarchaeia archaeon]